MSAIINLDSVSLQQHLARASQPVLLDLWAPWCAPCRALTPTLEQLASDASGRVQIAKLNVDESPGIMQRLQARGIPTLILFKGGVEAARLSGSQRLRQLHDWLQQQGIELSASQPAKPHPIPQWGAFYGDPQLRDFLLARLRQALLDGKVSHAIQPYWNPAQGQGSLAASLVNNERLAVFERVTGLPAAVALLLEFVALLDIQDVDRLLMAIRPQSNLSQTPLAYLQALLDDASLRWPELLDDPTLEQLRQRWQQGVTAQLAGSSLPDDHWQALRQQATALQQNSLQGYLAELIAIQSPPAPVTDIPDWSRSFMLLHWIRHHLLMAAAGWSASERTKPDQRHQWFRAQTQIKGEDAALDEAQLARLRQRWEHENQEFMRKEQDFHQQFETLLRDFNQRQQQRLLPLLEAAPVHSPA